MGKYVSNYLEGFVHSPCFIRNIAVSPGLVLSPMSGVTSSAFRRLIKELNPGALGLVVSEFISVEGLTRGSFRSQLMMRFHQAERPLAIQVFGYDIERLRDGARMAEDAGADIVDLNCGCPAPKVVKRGGGCQLMREPLHLANVLREMRKALSIPLTIKIRSGWDDSNENATEIALIAEAEGVEAIAVHGRTRVQLYRGESNWNVVYQVADRVKVPVFGSGDVVDQDGALARLKGSPCKQIAGVYIGRGALRNPFIFKEIVSGSKVDMDGNEGLALSVLKRYVTLLLEECSERATSGKLKQLVSQMCKGFIWRKELLRATTLAEELHILDTRSSCIDHEVNPSLCSAVR